MLFHRRSPIRTFLAVLLVAGTAFAVPAMALAGTGMAHMGAHAGDHGHPPGPGSSDRCCDLCLASCSAHAGAPVGTVSLEVESPVVAAEALLPAADPRTSATPYLLPHSQAPPPA